MQPYSLDLVIDFMYILVPNILWNDSGSDQRLDIADQLPLPSLKVALHQAQVPVSEMCAR